MKNPVNHTITGFLVAFDSHLAEEEEHELKIYIADNQRYIFNKFSTTHLFTHPILIAKDKLL